MRASAICAGLAVMVFAQDSSPDWDSVVKLSRVKLHQREIFQHIPNYVCQETVERFRSAANHPSRKLDTLRFEVATVGHAELLKLPGAGGFERAELSSFASEGLLGTGSFAALLLNIFSENRARITAHHPPGLADTLAYDFDLPAFLNGLEITVNGNRGRVEEKGAFWVNAEDLNLTEIESHVVDPPVWSGMREIGSKFKYAPMQIGGFQVLLPQSAELTVLNYSGESARNEITFSGCREYVSESTVRFGDPVEPPKKK